MCACGDDIFNIRLYLGVDANCFLVFCKLFKNKDRKSQKIIILGFFVGFKLVETEKRVRSM
jgi:hypothetical protein